MDEYAIKALAHVLDMVPDRRNCGNCGNRSEPVAGPRGYVEECISVRRCEDLNCWIPREERNVIKA